LCARWVHRVWHLASAGGRHLNGASDSSCRGNAAGAVPEHGWSASAGDSGCRRSDRGSVSAECAICGADDDFAVARHAVLRGGIRGTTRFRRRWETDFTAYRLRSVRSRYWRTWLSGTLRRGGGWWSAELAHGTALSSRCAWHRGLLRQCLGGEQGSAAVTACRRVSGSVEHFDASRQLVRTERQEGNGRGDTVRLLARGILRRV